MAKTYADYLLEIRESLDRKYLAMIKLMRADGMPDDEIRSAIMACNAKDVLEAQHIGEDPSTN